METLPYIDKRNFKKVLRELDLSKFPSLPEYLKEFHYKLKKKTVILTEIEELLIYNKLIKYFKDYRLELNKDIVNNINWERVQNRPPMPFQKEGIKFLLFNNRCILADEQGLGKSIQSILASLFLPDDFKILIITTNTLKYNFELEIKHYDDRISVIKDTKKWNVSKFTIVHYGQLKNLEKEIINEQFDVIICDEAHYIKEPSAKRSKYCLNIFEKCKKEIKYVWLLTGTPISNRPIEYYNLLRIIKHPLHKNYYEFIKKYCNAFKDYYGHWQIGGASNLQDLYDKTKGSILRRLKKDVLKELPSKERIPIFLELKNIKKYNNCIKDYEKKKYEELEDFIKELPFNYRVPDIAKMMIQRQFCAIEKIRDNSLIELIEGDIDEGNKVVVFTNFKMVVSGVYDHFTSKRCRYIDGSTKPEDRVLICKEFNGSKDLKVMVVNIAVGAEGLNLQSATIGIINDMHLVPGKMLQVEDRLHRIGQERKVTIKYPIYKDTVEGEIHNMIINKMHIVTEVMDGEKQDYFDKKIVIEDESLNTSILDEIFNKIDKVKL